MRIATLAAVLLAVHCMPAWAQDDQAAYNERAARTDMAQYRELDRAGKGLLAREDTRSDLNLGPRFDDIDTNRDGIVTQQEMRTYIERKYGVIVAPG